MIFHHAFKRFTAVTALIVLLLGLPASGMSQSKALQAEEPQQLMEEVIVLGAKPLVELKLELYQAEEALYDLFNALNTDDDLDVRCYKEAPIGSHIKRRVCHTRLQRKLLRRASQRMMQGERYVYPAAELGNLEKRLLTNMTETALKQPEMLEALMKATEAKQALESERERRCEERFLFCW